MPLSELASLIFRLIHFTNVGTSGDRNGYYRQEYEPIFSCHKASDYEKSVDHPEIPVETNGHGTCPLLRSPSPLDVESRILSCQDWSHSVA